MESDWGSGGSWSLSACGAALGVLALFKHNIAAYALIGLVVAVGSSVVQEPFRLKNVLARACRPVLMLFAGCALPVIPVLFYMEWRGALGAMVRTLLFGPGEFLLGRLNSLPSPLIAIAFAVLLFGTGFAASRFRGKPGVAGLVVTVAGALMSIFLLKANQSLIDPIIFYAPVLIIGAAAASIIFGGSSHKLQRATLIAVLAAATAAFMESFPRFAREQAVSAMPFVILLLFHLLWRFKTQLQGMAGGSLRFRALMLIGPLAFVLMGGRLFLSTYLDGLSFKSRTELRAERGRGVYFPKATAEEIDETVDYIQEKVPPGKYFFAHSYAGSSFLFFADRNNPSGAQFWGGAGVGEEEKRATLASLRQRDVRLVITSDRDLSAERFEPMRSYLKEGYAETKRIGDVLVLERRP